MTLRISTVATEGVYQGSKWLKVQVLCDRQELQSLFEILQPFWIVPLGKIYEGKPMPTEVFLAEYGRWMEGLQQGIVPTDADLRKCLAAAITDDLDALWLQDVGRGYLTKIGRPVVQMQSHFFSYSRMDKVFRPMSMGERSIFWGLQFSFPQIYQEASTLELKKVEAGALFRKIQLWAREWTRPTPFIVEGARTNVPLRIGKKSLSWVGLKHPQLLEQQIGVYVS